MNKQTMKNKDYKYSIRKLSWGAGSVAVSTVVTMSVFGLLSTDIFASETEPTSIIETIEQSDFEKETSINAIIEEDNQQQDTEVENQDIDDAMIIETQESTVETQDTDTETIVEQQESITETTSEKIVENVVEDVNEEDSLSVQEQSISIDLTSTVSNSASYSIENNVITILTGGDYIFTGENQLAQIVIDASVTEDVIITLKDTILYSIYSASKNITTTIIVPENYSSTVADSETNTNKGAIQIKGDLIIEGSGSLYVSSLSESAHAIKVGKSLTIDDITLVLYSLYKDGIHTDETVTINGSTLSIEALNGDGIQVEDDSATGDDNQGNIIVNSGEITIVSNGQSLQGTNDVIINGGYLHLTSTESEGMEGRHVIINGGEVTIIASDDGINATDFTTKDSYIQDGGTLVAGYSVNDMGIEIHGGNIYVIADGDGLDSNGYILIDGGVTVVYSTGASDATSSALDHDGLATINGGEVWLLSTYNGMIETFDQGSQAYIESNASSNKGSTIVIKDASGNVIDSETMTQNVSHVIYSGQQIQNNQTYTINGNTAMATTTRQQNQGPMGDRFPGQNNQSGMNPGQMPPIDGSTGGNIPTGPNGQFPQPPQQGQLPPMDMPQDQPPMLQQNQMENGAPLETQPIPSDTSSSKSDTAISNKTEDKQEPLDSSTSNKRQKNQNKNIRSKSSSRKSGLNKNTNLTKKDSVRKKNETIDKQTTKKETNSTSTTTQSQPSKTKETSSVSDSKQNSNSAILGGIGLSTTSLLGILGFKKFF